MRGSIQGIQYTNNMSSRNKKEGNFPRNSMRIIPWTERHELPDRKGPLNSKTIMKNGPHYHHEF